MIKRYFLTGLVLLLPAVVTILIMVFIMNLLTRPFLQTFEDLFKYYGLLDQPLWIFTSHQVLAFFSRIMILIFLILLTIATGILTRIFFARYFIRLGDYIIHKIPVVNKIYKAAQDVVKTLFSEEKQAFSQVVLVNFPHDHSYSIGMVTNDCISEESDSEHGDMLSVFIPATPNPTMGFIVMVRRSDVVFTDMKVDDALRAIISCGVIFKEGVKSA